MKVAACRGMDFKLFFPSRGHPAAPEAYAACARCTVTHECLEFALEHNVDVGLYGGLSAKKRKQLVSERVRARV